MKPNDSEILTYICDNKRRLVCLPYSKENLHRMSKDLNIKQQWYHHIHFDIPVSMINKITPKCVVVSSNDIYGIIDGEITELNQLNIIKL